MFAQPCAGGAGVFEIPEAQHRTLSHTATLLHKRRGARGRGALGGATAELYDPTSGTVDFTGSLATGRVGHTATLLPNGKVLVAGGYHSGNSSLNRWNCTIQRPEAGKIPAASSDPENHSATLLSTGQVLVAGGRLRDGVGGFLSRVLNSTIRQVALDVDRQSRQRAPSSHTATAAQRRGACCRRSC